MGRSEKYNTKQRDILLNIIKKQKHEFTIKYIYNFVKEDVGMTTIYRFVDKLVNDGKISKYIGKDNITYYQYLEDCNMENHFYLKCNSCGNILHVDCDCIMDLSNHILKKHKFNLIREKIIINGFCDKCLKKGE